MYISMHIYMYICTHIYHRYAWSHPPFAPPAPPSHPFLLSSVLWKKRRWDPLPKAAAGWFQVCPRFWYFYLSNVCIKYTCVYMYTCIYVFTHSFHVCPRFRYVCTSHVQVIYICVYICTHIYVFMHTFQTCPRFLVCLLVMCTHLCIHIHTYICIDAYSSSLPPFSVCTSCVYTRFECVCKREK